MVFEKNQAKRKLDPADTRQQIPDVQLHILCCRYWMIKEWECANMSAPFWRIYHNTIPGAKIWFQEHRYDLTPDVWLLIPPHTSFATSLKTPMPNADNEKIMGQRIEPTDKLSDIEANAMVDHLFVHFNLGMSYNMIDPQIFVIKCQTHHHELGQSIKTAVIQNHEELGTGTSLALNILILNLLSTIPLQQWGKSITDRRVVDAISYMRENDLLKFTNNDLASRANMATNAFARLFKDNTGTTIQQYLMKIRIEKACLIMHHSSHSIDDIAMRCGFFDRHHFSKAFKQALSVTPAYYMKKLTMMQ